MEGGGGRGGGNTNGFEIQFALGLPGSNRAG